MLTPSIPSSHFDFFESFTHSSKPFRTRPTQTDFPNSKIPSHKVKQLSPSQSSNSTKAGPSPSTKAVLFHTTLQHRIIRWLVKALTKIVKGGGRKSNFEAVDWIWLGRLTNCWMHCLLLIVWEAKKHKVIVDATIWELTWPWPHQLQVSAWQPAS